MEHDLVTITTWLFEFCRYVWTSVLGMGLFGRILGYFPIVSLLLALFIGALRGRDSGKER